MLTNILQTWLLREYILCTLYDEIEQGLKNKT